MQLTLDETLSETLATLAKAIDQTPESLALELLCESVRNCVEQPELLGLEYETRS